MKYAIYVLLVLLVSGGTSTAGWKEIFDKVFSMHAQDTTVTPEIVFHDTAVGTMACNVPQKLLLGNGMPLQNYVSDYVLSIHDILKLACTALYEGNYKDFNYIFEKYSDSIVNANEDDSIFNSFVEKFKIQEQTFKAMPYYVKQYLFMIDGRKKYELIEQKLENFLIHVLQDYGNHTCNSLSQGCTIQALIDHGFNTFGYSYAEGNMFAFLRCGFPAEVTGEDKVWYRAMEGTIGGAYCIFLAKQKYKQFEDDPEGNLTALLNSKETFTKREGVQYSDRFFKAYVSYLFMRCLFQNMHNMHKADIFPDKMKALYNVLVKVLPDEVAHFLLSPQALTCFGIYSINRVLHDYKTVLLSLVKNNAYTDMKVDFK